MEFLLLLKVFMSIVLVGVFGLFLHFYRVLVTETARVRQILKKQGINGPPPSFLLGNLLEVWKLRKESSMTITNDKNQLDHNWIVHLFPHLEQWRKQYGDLFTFSLGTTKVIYVNKPDLVKEIATCTSYDLGKPSYHRKELGSLLGEGILTTNGPTWAHHRKVLAPELYKDKVKGMIHLFAESANILVAKWMRIIDQSEGGVADTNIDEDMRAFSGDVIARTCFGSSYEQGNEIFERLKILQKLTCAKLFSVGLPGLTYLPTKANREAWKLEKEIHSLILELVKERKAKGAERDLLQMILEGADTGEMSKEEIDKFIVSNCKNMFLAAHEASAVGATWCLMLLAAHPEWQERVRAEVNEICQGTTPDSDMLLKMKQLTWVLLETLRLYPNGPALARETLNDITIGDIHLPKGVCIYTMVEVMHIDPAIWGPDAHSFNPERFANGVNAACKLPHAFFPFGFGPRICVGQYLATVELKMLVATVLSNFSISLSPKYVHSPAVKLVIKPKFGVDLLIKRL